MKLFARLLALLAAIFILSAVALPALTVTSSAATMTAGDDADNSDNASGDSPLQEDIVTLTGFREQLFPHWKEVILLEADQELDPENLPKQIAKRNYLVCDCDDGGGYALPVTWSTEVPHEPGLYYITGTLSLYDDTVLAEDFDGIETWPVFRLGEGVVLDAAVELPSMVDPLICQNGDPTVDVSFALPEARVLVGEDAYLPLDIAWSWDWSGVVSDTLGQYTVTGTLTGVPDWVCLPEEACSVSFPVYVLPGDRIEIYGLLHLYQDYLNIGWTYESSAVSEVVLEQQTADGQWEACPESWYRWSPWAPGNLQLYLMEFPTETDIVLRLRYQDVVDGNAVERFSEPITLNVPANIAEILAEEGTQIPDDLFNGDRDGSDSGGTDLPDYEQPAPEWALPEGTFTAWQPPEEDAPAQPPEEERETVTEIVTDTYTALSGLRLEQLTQLDDRVLFEKQGAAVEIPSHLLENLALSDWELLETTILRPADNAVELEILAAGERVTDLTGTVIRMPWDPADGTELQVMDQTGTVLGEAVCEASGTVWFVINQPGTYLVQAVAAVQEPSVQEPPAEDVVPTAPQETEPPEPPEEEPHSPEVEPTPEPIPTAPPEAEPEGSAPESPAEPEENPSAWPWWLAGLLLLAGVAAFLWRRCRHD